jgi:large subunit ribosomal protein L6
MSRLIKKPIETKGTTLTESDGFLIVKGPKGEDKVVIPSGVAIKIEGENIWVSMDPKAKTKTTAIQGTVWALLGNAVVGVTEGYTKVLEIEGVGYRAVLEGKELVLFLGYALPVRVPINDAVTIVVEKNVIKVSGINKDAVGRAAAEIRALKKPEPYKGKGIHYQGEVIRRKVGKKAGAGSTA